MTKHQKLEVAVAIVLVLCVGLVAAWMIAAKLAARPFDELRLKAEDFEGFSPRSDMWSIRLIHVKASPTEPTVIAYLLKRPDHRLPTSDLRPPTSGPFLVRIVHGYNMVDCMRIKQYDVELMADTRGPTPISAFPFQLSDLPVQMWRLTSSVGDRSVWITTMLRTADFAATSVDTRDMAFPRVGTPDDPSWAPTGLKWSSFRHPIRNARNALRARWNASRCDIWTFLRLRQPAWASDEMLTLVTEYRGPSVEDGQEEAVAEIALQAHAFMLREFQGFWGKRGKQND
jgi:hypothetical protein